MAMDTIQTQTATVKTTWVRFNTDEYTMKPSGDYYETGDRVLVPDGEYKGADSDNLDPYMVAVYDHRIYGVYKLKKL